MWFWAKAMEPGLRWNPIRFGGSRGRFGSSGSVCRRTPVLCPVMLFVPRSGFGMLLITVWRYVLLSLLDEPQTLTALICSALPPSLSLCPTVGLLDDDDSMFISPPLSTLSNRISNSNPSGASSGPAEVTAAAAAGPASPTPPPPSGAPLYGQPGTFERLADVGELLELLGRSARSGSRVALLDVRDEGEGETDG